MALGHKDLKGAQKDTRYLKIFVLVIVSNSFLSITVMEELIEFPANGSLKIPFDYWVGCISDFKHLRNVAITK